jgi:predicted RND superfamily exporter protein
MRRFVEGVLRYRFVVLAVMAIVTGVLALQVRHLRVIIDPNTTLPHQHPYVTATKRVESLFGSEYVVVVGITAKAGDAFSPHVLGKVERITRAIEDLPPAVRGNVFSLAARRAKNIAGDGETMDVRPLMERVPSTDAEVEALRRAVRANPAYLDALVSRDGRTVAVVAEVKIGRDGFRGALDRIVPIVDRERDPSVEVMLGGQPVYLAQIETYSQRMAFLFPLAVLVTGLIHYEAFRTLQGLVLPLVTALVAVLWALGIMGLAGVPMDAFNVTTPILVLAVTAGHAVQILKRYYEEYHRVRATTDLPLRAANRAAVVESAVRMAPVMLTAGSVAALGFLSLVAFDTTTIRTFGAFTGIGILSALVLEMTFIPALRSLLPAPGPRETRREAELRVWDRIADRIAGWVTGPGRIRILAVASALVALSCLALTRVVVDNANKRYFFPHFGFQQDDRALNARLGGTGTLYLLVEGRDDDAIKDPRVLRALDETQRFLERQPDVGKTLSIADFVKQMHRAMNGGDAAYDRIPDSRELVSQYLLLYSMSGEPGDFDAYVDYEYRTANAWIFLKTDSSAEVEALIARVRAFAADRFGPDIRLGIGGNLPQQAALNEVIARGKILNIVQIAGVILLVTSAVFRSVAAGALVLVPLLAAVLVNFGLMGATGIRLNIATAIISAMAVGIGADYAIYLIYRIREELARGVEETTAVRTALTTAGKAILFVASAVAGGYGVLLFSWGFYIHIWFAILIATAMLVSSFGALTILPSLILTLRPAFIFGRGAPRLAAARDVAALLVVGATVALGPAPAGAEAPSPREIMERSAAVGKVLDSVQEATFTLVNRSGQERVRRTFGVTKLQANGADAMRMVRFLSPADVKGTVTVLVEHSGADDDIWVYLPALRKVRRLVASNKRDSFVGTDFSYGDVIGHKVDEWDHRLVREESVDGQRCYVVESLPRGESVKAGSGYSRRLSWVRADNFYAVKGEFWDTAGRPLKTQTATELRLVDPARDKWQAMRLVTTNLQTGHRTVIAITEFKANQRVGDDLFTTRYMERDS